MRLRAQRAALLGFATHAAVVTADETRGTPRPSPRCSLPLAASAAKNARRSRSTSTRSTPTRCSESWDWAFYTEKVRQAKYDVDTAALRPWFEAERVLRDGVFFAATRCTA